MKCEISRCRNEAAIIYIRHHVCWECWKKHCDGKLDIKKQLVIE